MDFWYEKEVSADRAQTDALEEPMQLKAGVIKHMWILHPAGCAGLLHTQILHRGHQLWPTLKGGSYHTDAYPIEFDEEWKIKKPAELTIRSWNLDDTYNHTVYVRVTVMKDTIDPFMQAFIDMVAILKKMMGIGE